MRDFAPRCQRAVPTNPGPKVAKVGKTQGVARGFCSGRQQSVSVWRVCRRGGAPFVLDARTMSGERDAPSEPSKSVFPPGGGVAVVVNGRARNVTDDVLSNLDQILRGTDLFVSHSLEQAASIAELVVSRGYGTVLTGGGDGTFTIMVSEIVRVADKHGKPRPRFGFIKLGTGNALAHVVGASGKRGLAADIRRLKGEAGSRKIGLVEVDGLLSPFCGFGADAALLLDYQAVKNSLSQTPLKPFASGLFSYFFSGALRTLPSLLLQRMPHCRVVNCGAEAYRLGSKGRVIGQPIPTGEVVYEGPARLAGLSTIPYYGFGLRMFPYASERDDRMHLRILTMSPAEFARNLPSIWRGDYENPDSIFDFLVSDVRIEMDPATAFQVGGDVQDERREVRIRLSDKPIRLVDFYAPPRTEVEFEVE
jgi:diacylglycerol kinase family enzyme